MPPLLPRPDGSTEISNRVLAVGEEPGINDIAFTGTMTIESDYPSCTFQTVALPDSDNAPARDGVNLQCVNSSDFVVGKQTTFNGPVTIINYADSEKVNAHEAYKPSKEEIVIREKIITPSSISEINTFAEKKSNEPVIKEGKKEGARLPVWIKKKFLRVPLFLWVLLFLILIFNLVLFLGLDDNGLEGSEGHSREPRTITYNGKKYNFFTREDWDARPPLSEVEMKTPVPYVVISHSATGFCYMKKSCMTQIRNFQGDHLNRSPPLADIAYSFLVGGDGNIYEGRGWNKKTAVQGFANGKNININFIGSFENFDSPTYPQTEAAKALIEYGLNNSYIDPNFSLIADNSTHSTLSPGIQVYKEIQNWPNFDPDPKSHPKD